MYNLLCSLHFLHSSNIVHRDIKPSNILVDSECQIMLCDYGLSRTLPESIQGKHNGQSHKVRQSILRKLASDAPEDLKRDQINKKVQKIQKINSK